MSTRRKDETIEEWRVRHAAYQRATVAADPDGHRRRERERYARLGVSPHRRAYQAAYYRTYKVCVSGQVLNLARVPPEVREVGLLLKEARRVIKASKSGELAS